MAGISQRPRSLFIAQSVKRIGMSTLQSLWHEFFFISVRQRALSMKAGTRKLPSQGRELEIRGDTIDNDDDNDDADDNNNSNCNDIHQLLTERAAWVNQRTTRKMTSPSLDVPMALGRTTMGPGVQQQQQQQQVHLCLFDWPCIPSDVRPLCRVTLTPSQLRLCIKYHTCIAGMPHQPHSLCIVQIVQRIGMSTS